MVFGNDPAKGTNRLDTLKKLDGEYAENMRAAGCEAGDAGEARAELRAFRGDRTSTATRKRALLRRRIARPAAFTDRAVEVRDLAVKHFGALSPQERDEARALNLAVRACPLFSFGVPDPAGR